MASFHFLVHHLLTFPLTKDRFEKEKKFIKDVAKCNEYPENLVDKFIRPRNFKLTLKNSSTFQTDKEECKFVSIPYEPRFTKGLSGILKHIGLGVIHPSGNKLQQLLGNPKDKIETNERSGIYEVSCQNCEKYVGQTRRSISARFKELAHLKYGRTESSVAQHAFENNHKIDISNLRLINNETNRRLLVAFESLQIAKCKNSMNSDRGPIPGSPLFWLTEHGSSVRNNSLEIVSEIKLNHDHLIRSPGDSLVVICSDSQNRSMTWTSHKGKQLSEETKPKVETSKLSHTSLYFTNITVIDQGNYTCRVDDEKKVFRLEVVEPLVFADKSNDEKGEEGSDLVLRCDVMGRDTTPVISWYVGGEEPKPPKFNILADGLLIRNLTKEDSKVYVCRATQTKTGDVKNREIKVTVWHKPYPRRPEVWKAVELVWAYVGSQVNLTCDTIAEPEPKFVWYMGDRELKLNRKNNESVLQLHLKNETLFGTYQCRASNKYGTIQRIFKVRKGVRPEPPEYIEESGKNSYLLDLAIGAPEQNSPGMEPIGYDVQYRISDGKKHQWTNKVFNVSDANSYALLNLQHSTKYEIRVATRNVAGLSPYTNSSFFQTLPSKADCPAKSMTLIHFCLITLMTAFTCW